MFENAIAEIFNRLLGSWIEEDSFQSDRVSTSVFKGHVSLSKLEFRKDALDRFLLPITLKRGFVSSAEIIIPWTSLGSKSLEINLDDVFLLLHPKTEWTDEEMLQREQASKSEKLLQAEVLRGMNRTETFKPEHNFASRIMNRMVVNVIVRLKNVHIRMETEKFSFGITLDSCTLQNTSAQWLPQYNADPSLTTHKLCEVKGLSMYTGEFVSRQVILHPVNQSLRITRSMTFSKLEVFSENTVNVSLSTEYLGQILSLVKLRAVSKHRPKQFHAKLFWAYAIRLVLKQVRETRYRRTKAYFAKRRRDRLEYGLLWKLYIGNTSLAMQERVRLEWLEKCLDLNDILLFRSLAENEMRLAKAQQELWEMTNRGKLLPVSLPPQQSDAGWVSWALGMGASKSGFVNNGSNKESVSQQDVERFLSLLRFNPAKHVLEMNPLGVESHQNRWLVVHVPLLSVIFHPGLRLRIEGLEFERKGHKRLDFSIQSCRVFDGIDQLVGSRSNRLVPHDDYLIPKRLVRTSSQDFHPECDGSVSFESIQEWLDLSMPSKESNLSPARLFTLEQVEEDVKVMMQPVQITFSPLLLHQMKGLLRVIRASSWGGEPKATTTSSFMKFHCIIQSPVIVIPLNLQNRLAIVRFEAIHVQDHEITDASSLSEEDDEEEELEETSRLVTFSHLQCVLVHKKRNETTQLLDPVSFNILFGQSRARIDFPTILHFRMFPLTVQWLQEFSWKQPHEEESQIVVNTSWHQSWLVTLLASTEEEHMIRTFSDIAMFDPLKERPSVEKEADDEDDENDALSDFFTLYDDLAEIMSEKQYQRDSESHYSFRTAETRRSRKSKKKSIAAQSRSKHGSFKYSLKLFGIRVHAYKENCPHFSSASRPAAKSLFLARKLPVLQPSESSTQKVSSLVEDWLKEVEEEDEDEKDKILTDTGDVFNSQTPAWFISQLDRLDANWTMGSQFRAKFRLGSLSCHVLGGDYVFSTDLKMAGNALVVDNTRHGQEVFLSADWEESVLHVKTFSPVDIIVHPLVCVEIRDWLKVPGKKKKKPKAPEFPRTTKVFHFLLSFQEVRFWWKTDSSFVFHNLELACKYDAEKCETKGRIGSLAAVMAGNEMAIAKLNEEEDVFSLTYLFPLVESSSTVREGETVHDEIIDSILGDDFEETYSVWLQGGEMSVTLSSLQISVPALLQLHKDFVSTFPPRFDQAKGEKSFLVRFQVTLVQSEFILPESVHLIAERIFIENSFYLSPTKDVLERMDFSCNALSLSQEVNLGNESKLARFLNPPLQTIRIIKFENQVTVKCSDVNIIMDEKQWSFVERSLKSRNSNNSEAGKDNAVELKVSISHLALNLVSYVKYQDEGEEKDSMLSFLGKEEGLVVRNTSMVARENHLQLSQQVHTHQVIATMSVEALKWNSSVFSSKALSLKSNGILLADFPQGFFIDQSSSPIVFSVTSPILRYDRQCVQQLTHFFNLGGSSERGEVSLVSTPSASFTPPVSKELKAFIFQAEMWFLPPVSDSSKTAVVVCSLDSLECVFKGSVATEMNLQGFAMFLQFQEQRQTVCFPFNLTLQNRNLAVSSSLKCEFRMQDIKSISSVLGHCFGGGSKGLGKSGKPNNEPIVSKLVVHSMSFVLLSDFKLPFVQLLVSSLHVENTKESISGQLLVKMAFSKRPQHWQVLLEENSLTFHYMRNHIFSMTCTQSMEWNLSEALLDKPIAAGRVKIRSFVNHTGMLSVERVKSTRMESPSPDADTYFCMVGDILTFMFKDKEETFFLRNVPCPKPGQAKKFTLQDFSSFVVLETCEDVLVIRSLLQLRNETATPLEVYVADTLHLSRPETPTTPNSSSMEDIRAANVIHRRRSRIRQPLGVLWSVSISPNEAVNVPPAIAQLVLFHGNPLCIRPHITWGPADFSFSELVISHSARLNEKNMKRSMTFEEENHAHMSMASSFSEGDSSINSAQYVVVHAKWVDPFCQCVVLAAPLVLVNHLNCAATYCLDSVFSSSLQHQQQQQIPRCDGQLPVGAELKWNGMLPVHFPLLRISLKLPNFEWSDPIPVGQENREGLVLEVKDPSNRVLQVNARFVYRDTQLEVTFSVPYWVVNKTQLPILCSSISSFGIAAGQTTSLATMRRIRLQSQLQQHSSAPTGLLEILEEGESNPLSEHILLYSKSDFKLRFWNSKWSTTGCMLELGSEFVLECKQEWALSTSTTRALYVVSAKVSNSKFPETKLVTISPRFQVINTLDSTLRVRQCRSRTGLRASSDASFRSHPLFSAHRELDKRTINSRSSASTLGSGVISLIPGEAAPFHWRDKSGLKEISACFDEFGWEWSSGVQIDDCVGEYCSRMRNSHTQCVYLLRVDVQYHSQSHTVSVTFRKELVGLPPYRIDNLSLFTIQFRQVGAPPSCTDTLLPYHSSAYSWDLFSKKDDRLLCVEILPRSHEEGEPRRLTALFLHHPQQQQQQLSQENWLGSLSWFSRPRVLGTFSLDRTFGFLNSSFNLSVSLQTDGPTRVLTICDSRVLEHRRSRALLNATTALPTVEGDSLFPHFEFRLDFQGGVGISILEDEPLRELLRIYLFHPSFSFSKQVLPLTTMEEVSTTLQVPVVWGHVFEFRLKDLQIDNQTLKAAYPVLLCSNYRNQDEGDFIVARMVKSTRFQNSLEFLKSVSLSISPMQLNLDADILRSMLMLVSRVNKKFTNHFSPTPAMRPRSNSTSSAFKIYVEDLRIDPIQIRVNFRGVFALFGSSQWLGGAHVEGASLRLENFTLAHSLLSQSSDPIAHRVFTHYMHSLRRHWFVLLSSVDLLGDPIGLGKTVVQGLVDSLVTIQKGSVGTSPLVFGLGVIHGGWILGRSIVFGVTNSLVNLFNGASAALNFVAKSKYVDFPRPRNFFHSVAQGVAGLVVHPFSAMEREHSFRALVYGLVKGWIGLVALPLLGGLHVLTRLMSAVRGSVDFTSKVRMTRTRPPRYLRPGQSIENYDAKRSEGESFLWQAGLGHLTWMGHFQLANHLLLVLTDLKLIVLRMSDEDENVVVTIACSVDKAELVRVLPFGEHDFKLYTLRRHQLAFFEHSFACNAALNVTSQIESWASVQ